MKTILFKLLHDRLGSLDTHMQATLRITDIVALADREFDDDDLRRLADIIADQIAHGAGD